MPLSSRPADDEKNGRFWHIQSRLKRPSSFFFSSLPGVNIVRVPFADIGMHNTYTGTNTYTHTHTHTCNSSTVKQELMGIGALGFFARPDWHEEESRWWKAGACDRWQCAMPRGQESSDWTIQTRSVHSGWIGSDQIGLPSTTASTLHCRIKRDSKPAPTHREDKWDSFYF
ncbi:unnamed protein product [Protopolystoma xenopodis]|uniref:Uncharacterized protein n=1 Tax=Protopolystoma xenopodis TaxID=117903 RepID=A0A448XFJ5_9PLAT|nr:unnamed protein product [Protopolystoma xenopodis]